MSSDLRGGAGSIGVVDEDNDDFPWVIFGSKGAFAAKERWLELVASDDQDPPFKVGDKVRLLNTDSTPHCSNLIDESFVGTEFTVREMKNMGTGQWHVHTTDSQGNKHSCAPAESFELVGDTTATEALVTTLQKSKFVNISQLQAEQGIKENNTMSDMKKLYRLKQDTPEFEAGAILKNSGSNFYNPIETIWDTEAQTKARAEGKVDNGFCGVVVENSPEWFEEIYESALGKVKYVTKEAAKATYDALFAAKKSK